MEASMTKKDFIALADYIKTSTAPFSQAHLDTLAAFCKSRNGNFMRERWMSYIKGECGPNGGAK
jgi:hypothetical protein